MASRSVYPARGEPRREILKNFLIRTLIDVKEYEAINWEEINPILRGRQYPWLVFVYALAN